MRNDRKNTLRRGTATVRPFASARDREGMENFEHMIANAKSANPLGVEDWSEVRWDFPNRSRGSSAGDGGLWFTVTKATRSGGKDPFPQPWMDFVKATVCHFEKRSGNGFAATQSQTLIRAASYLYKALTENGGVADPTRVTAAHLNRAIELAGNEMGAGVKNIGSKMGFIAGLVTSFGVVSEPLHWSNPIKSIGKHDRLGKEADERREKFLPAPAVLDALSDISRRTDLEPRDQLLQHGVELLVACGFRVNEALTLPRDCIVEEPLLDEDGAQMLDRFGKPATVLALRYWPEKLGHLEVRTKVIPSVIRDLVVRAIENVKRLTEPYAQVAAYQRDHPGGTLLGEPWDSLPPDAKLSKIDIGLALRLKRGDASNRAKLLTQVHQYLKGKTAPIRVHGTGRGAYILKRDLEAHLCARSMSGNVLRTGEGVQDLADCLFLIPHKFVHSAHEAGIPGTVQLLKDAMIDVYLGGIKGQPSIFVRLRYPNAEALRMETHAPRHLLNTLAQEGGLGEHEIARFFGRADAAHNRAYDHTPPAHRGKKLRARMMDGGAIGPIATAAATIRDPQRRAEFLASTASTAHLTDLGVCVHAWDVMPCQKHAACEGCTKLRVIKGDKRDQAAAQLALTDELLSIAREVMADGEWGADRWVNSHERSAIQLERIMAVHDGDLPDGTIVELSPLPEPDSAPLARRLGRR